MTTIAYSPSPAIFVFAIAVTMASLCSADGTEPRTTSGAPVIVRKSTPSSSNELPKIAAKPAYEAPVIKVTPGTTGKAKQNAEPKSDIKDPAGAPVIRVAPKKSNITAENDIPTIEPKVNDAVDFSNYATRTAVSKTNKNKISEISGRSQESILNSENRVMKVETTKSTLQVPPVYKTSTASPPKQIVKNAKSDWSFALASRIQAEGQLNLGIRQASSLRAESRVSRCEVENGEVCEALHFEPTEISIVGKSPGETRIAVWLDDQPQPLLWNIKVEEQKKTSDAGLDNRALTKLLAEMYPQSRIRLSSAEGELIVEGNAKNRKEAVQILSFIRSVRLVPVIDRVTVQRP